MYKDLMVPMTGTEADADALDLAVMLARSHDAHLSVLELVDLPLPLAPPWGIMPDTATDKVHASLRARGEANLARLKVRLAAEAISSEARLVEALYSEAPRSAAREAVYTDLTIVAGSTGGSVESIVPHAYFVTLLLESGRPVLVVPPHCAAPAPMKRLMIAWQPTREAARAMHDALPLLMAAERVDMVIVDTSDARGSEESARRAVRHLAHHGIEAHQVVCSPSGRSVATAILQHAREMRADALIAGGYGHSRLREWALGGVTRELLIGADLPIFFGH